jgi:hypothetical protein
MDGKSIQEMKSTQVEKKAALNQKQKGKEEVT